MLYSVEPRSSQWPSMVTRTCEYERKNSAVFVRLARASPRISDLLKSKYASFTFCSNSSLKLWFADGGASTGAAPTVTRASAVAVPPGPVAVMVKVVDCVGLDGVEPCAVTFPTPGSISRSVAFVDAQLRVTVSPLFTELGEAFSVTVGCPVGCGAASVGGWLATCFLQPPAKDTKATSPSNNPRFLRQRSCIYCLLRRSCEGLAGDVAL